MEAAYRGDTLKARASSDFCFWNFKKQLKQLILNINSILNTPRQKIWKRLLKLTQVKEAVEKGADVDAADAYGPGPYFPSAICSISGELKEPDIRWMRYDQMKTFTIFP